MLFCKRRLETVSCGTMIKKTWGNILDCLVRRTVEFGLRAHVHGSLVDRFGAEVVQNGEFAIDDAD